MYVKMTTEEIEMIKAETKLTKGDREMMIEHGILFKPEMVAAILKGTKTQTRRLKKKPWPVGGILWVREAWRVVAWPPMDESLKIQYKDGETRRDTCLAYLSNDTPYEDWYNRVVEQSCAQLEARGWKGDSENYYSPEGRDEGATYPTKWRPSIHMPRGCSRIDLRVTAVREERLQDIREADVLAEGIDRERLGEFFGMNRARLFFEDLWDSINTEPGTRWGDNPPVWVYEFEKVEGARS